MNIYFLGCKNTLTFAHFHSHQEGNRPCHGVYQMFINQVSLPGWIPNVSPILSQYPTGCIPNILPNSVHVMSQDTPTTSRPSFLWGPPPPPRPPSIHIVYWTQLVNIQVQSLERMNTERWLGNSSRKKLWNQDQNPAGGVQVGKAPQPNTKITIFKSFLIHLGGGGEGGLCLLSY